MNRLLTSNNSIKDLPEYNIIGKTVVRLIESGIIDLGSGYCIGMSDMIMMSLLHQGIKSHLVEVTLTISYNTRSNNPTEDFIGFDNRGLQDGDVSTHVVVITQTDPPILIDSSIGYKLPPQQPVVVDGVKSHRDGVISTFEYSDYDLKLTYVQKNSHKVAFNHEKSIINRIETDASIFKQLKLLRVLIFTALAVSSLSLVRGMFDAYQTYIVQDNYWGPSIMEKFEKDLRRIEEKLDKK